MFAQFEVVGEAAECSRIEWRRSKGNGRAVTDGDVREIPDLEAYVADALLRYSRIIDEFRANAGRVGGQFAGAPLLLLHHSDHRTGKRYVAPIFFMASEEPGRIYVFATLGGGLSDPHWYENIMAAGSATVELGTAIHDVVVEEVTGDERDRVYAEQASRYPVFHEYERLNDGVRVIPVVSLRHVVATPA